MNKKDLQKHLLVTKLENQEQHLKQLEEKIVKLEQEKLVLQKKILRLKTTISQFGRKKTISSQENNNNFNEEKVLDFQIEQEGEDEEVDFSSL